MRSEKFVPLVRHINGIEIYQKSPQDIQVRKGKNSILLTRWKQPRQFAGGWPNLRRCLFRNKIESIGQIIKLANDMNVLVLGARHPEDPPDNAKRIK